MRCILSLGLTALWTSAAFALPSLDPKLQTETVINGFSFKLIRDADELGKWYYIPPRLRVVQGDEGPSIHVVTYVADGKEHAIIQASVTASATGEELQKVHSHLEQWYKKNGRPRPSISLSVIGPLRSSTFRMLSLQATGKTYSLQPLWDPVAGGGSEVEAKEVKSPDGQEISVRPAKPDLQGRGLTVPGGHLNQNVSLQYEVSGTAATQIYEALLKSKAGGMALIWVGEYDAMSVPAKVEVELNVQAAQSYFREYERTTKRRRFFFWGSNKTEVRDFLRTSNFLNRSLKIKIDGNPEVLESDKLDQIAEKLMNWVAHQCFTVKQLPGNAKPPAESAPNVDVDMGNFSTLFGLPPLKGLGLVVGFSSACSKHRADYRTEFKHTATATWIGRTVVREKLAIAGNVSLGRFPNPDDLVRRLTIRPLPKILLRLPAFEDEERAAIVDGSQVTLKNPLKSGADALWNWQFGKGRVWKYRGEPGETGQDESQRQKEFPNCPSIVLNRDETTDQAKAVFVANRINRHLGYSGAEIDRFTIEKGVEPETNLIDFSGERFPLRQMHVNPEFFPFGAGPGEVRGLTLRFGVEGGDAGAKISRKLETDPVVLPPFHQARNAEMTFLYPGEITAVQASVAYVDLFDRSVGTHRWTARKKAGAADNEQILTRIASGESSWIIHPEDIGLKNFQINPTLLFRQYEDAQLITLTLRSDQGKSFSKQWGADAKDEVLNFITLHSIRDVELTLDTADQPIRRKMSKDRVADLNDSVGMFRLLKTMFTRSSK